MSYMTYFQCPEEFQECMSGDVRNLADMRESVYQVNANSSPGDLVNTNAQDPFIDPRLLCSDINTFGIKVAPQPLCQRRQSQRLTKDTGKHAAIMKYQPANKKQPKSRAPKKEKANSKTVDVNHLNPRTRKTDDMMEWLDDEDGQWKPAVYHRGCRAELIALAAEQPGAPFWTEGMETNYTSFSTLTQGWTEDPDTVVDFQGRQVLYMEKPPPDWDKSPVYGHLVIGGFVILDHKDKPVRNIPGLPLTLDTDAPGWLLQGLRRCTRIEIPDFMARFPATRQTPSGIKPVQGETALTIRMERDRQRLGLKSWSPRPGARKKEQPSPAPKRGNKKNMTVRPRRLVPAPSVLGFDDPNRKASTVYSGNNTPESSMPYIEDPNQPQDYSGQMYPASALTKSNSYFNRPPSMIGMQNNFVHNSNFQFTQPHYATEVWAELPASSALTGCAEQMRADLTHMWPYPYL